MTTRGDSLDSESAAETPQRFSGRAAVFWSIAAMRELRDSLSKQRDDQRESELRSVFNRLLLAAFPGETVFVLHRLGGFNPQKPQHVLTVEVFASGDASAGSGESGGTASAHVVKIGLVDSVDEEVKGWSSVKPRGSVNDSILLPLSDRPASERDSRGRSWKAILYEDASSTIGTGNAVSLESAVLDSCQHDLPTAASVATCIYQVLNRLTTFFYGRSREEHWTAQRMSIWISWIADAPFAAAPDKPLRQSKFGQTIDRWREGQNSTVIWDSQQVLRELHHENLQTRNIHPPVDAVEAYEQLIRFCCWVAEPENAKQPAVAKLLGYLPSMLRGCAHGDLHGRNVLVGRYRSDADNPTVFDYETSGSDRLIAWDFVKLEYELKSRALAAILQDCSEREFVRSVAAFESELAETTNRAIEQSWEVALQDAVNTPLGRLASIILAIRREADTALAVAHRDHRWYEEYLFQLGLCGVMSVRYGNERRTQIAGYVVACLAVQGSRWFSKLSRWDSDRYAGAQAAADLRTLCSPVLGWQAPHQLAIGWLESGDSDLVAHAERLLSLLTDQFANEPRLWESRVLALLHLGRSERASELLEHVRQQFDTLTEELYCRFGRIEKDRGHDLFDHSAWEDATRHYQSAIRFYGDAFALDGGYYPAVNAASLNLLVAACHRQLERPARSKRHVEIARQAARELIDTRDRWLVAQAEDALWHLATLAEAHLIAGDAAESEKLYTQFREHPQATSRALESASKQKCRNETALAIIADTGG